jgi:hypothetical protein
VKEVVLIEDRSSRLSRLNIEPTKESDLRRAMSARNLPDAMLTVRAGRFKNDWEAAKELRDWLAQHPTARVIVLANEFDSREAAHVYRSALGSEANRVSWHTVRDVRFDATNWWRGRLGIVTVTNCYVSLLHTCLLGEPPQPAADWDPDR